MTTSDKVAVVLDESLDAMKREEERQRRVIALARETLGVLREMEDAFSDMYDALVRLSAVPPELMKGNQHDNDRK